MKNLYKGLLVTIWSVGLWLGMGTLVSAQTPVLIRSSGVSGLIATPDGLFFNSTGNLWRTNGTPQGTATVKGPTGQPVPQYSDQAVVNGRLYFTSGFSLMYIDERGIAQTLVNPGSSIISLFECDKQLCFTTASVPNSRNLWRTIGDGTQAVIVGSYPAIDFAVYKDQPYFLAVKVSSSSAGTTNERTLWRIPLPSTVAVEVTDLLFASDFGPQQFIVATGNLYISGRSSSPPFRPTVYKSDGTAAGTTILSLPVNFNSSDILIPRVENNQLYFAGLISGVGYSGRLYKVNPAANSIEDAVDIYGQLPAGTGLAARNAIRNFIHYKGLFYFSASNSSAGAELWRSDGTLVKDIQNGPGTSDPQNFHILNDLLYFSAEGNTGRELYRTDGTDAGTQLAAELTPGTGGSLPANLTTFNNELYFTTGSNIVVTALYKLPADVTTAPTPTGLVMTAPAYDCSTGQLTLSTTGGNGQPIEYRIAGLRDWSANNSFTVPPHQRTSTAFTLEARQSGVVLSRSFNPGVQCASVISPDYGPLVDLYSTTNGSNWTNKTNWLQGTSPCNWNGVLCDGNGRVVQLILKNNNLNGTLPASLGNVSELKTLIFGNEPNLSGTLPASLGNLSKLDLLEIEVTAISGLIPESFGNLKQLQRLFIDNNRFTGFIPTSLGTLSRLQNLYLFNNQLNYCIPTSFSALCGRDVRLASISGNDFRAFCATGAGACTQTDLVLNAPAYDCTNGRLTYSATGGNGQLIEYRVAGLRDWSTSNVFTVPTYQRNGTTFTLEARQNGQMVSLPFTANCPVAARIASAEASQSLKVVVYPNPVAEQFTVGVSGAAGQTVRYHLTNLSGQTLIDQRSKAQDDAHTETLRLPASGSGMYLLRVSTNGQSQTVKVLKP